MSDVIDLRAQPASGLIDALAYQFSDSGLLAIALTHASYRNENRNVPNDNERFEFLGDSVLGAAIGHMLLERYENAPEGVLTRYKAVLVSEPGLAETARQLNLGSYVRVGRGEMMTGGRDKNSVLANTMEAVFAAVYLDGGFDATFALIGRLYSQRIEDVGGVEQYADFKTKLQELVQLAHRELPHYRIVDVEGPDHDRVYSAAVTVLGKDVASGSGRSKKDAEQEAARVAYLHLIEE